MKLKKRAASYFTDREEPRSVFWNTVDEIQMNRDDFRIITYYGFGGIGKSTLLKKIAEELREKNLRNGELSVRDEATITYVLYNLETSTDMIDILWHLRYELSKNNPDIAFPMFDTAFLRFEEVSGENRSYKSQAKEPEYSNVKSFLFKAAKDYVPGVSTAGTIYEYVKMGRKALLDLPFFRNNPDEEQKELLEYLSEIGDYADSDQINELNQNLPVFFAYDLKKAALQSNTPLIIMLDTFELLEEARKKNDKSSEFSYREWLLNTSEGLLFQIPNIVWVLAGREKIFEYSHKNISEHLLGDLSEADTYLFLEKKGVLDPDIQKRIYEVTEGTPIFIDVCCEIYDSLKSRGEEPTVDSFTMKKEEVIERYVGRLSDTDRKVIRFMACMGRWIKDDFTDAYDSTYGNKSAINDDSSYEKIIRSSMIGKDEEERFFLHKTVMDAIYNDRDYTADQKTSGIRNIVNLDLRRIEDELSGDKRINQLQYYFEHLAFMCDQRITSSDEVQLIMDQAEQINEELKSVRLSLILPLWESLVHLAERLNAPYEDLRLFKRILISAYRNNGRYNDALEIAEELYKADIQTYGENDLKTMASLNQLALVYDGLGRYHEALEMSEKIFRVRKAKQQKTDPAVLQAAENLAIIYHHLGRYREALDLDRETYEIRKSLHGSDHPDTIHSESNLGADLLSLGRYAEALEYVESSAAKTEELFGSNYPETIYIMGSLMLIYVRLGRYEDAIDLGQKLLKTSNSVFGEDSDATLSIQNTLSLSYIGLKRLDDAIRISKDILEKRKRRLGEDHPDTVTSMMNLASSYNSAGQYAEALELNDAAYQINKDTLGEYHAKTIASENNLALSLSMLERHDDALSLFQDALDKNRTSYGELHPHTLKAQSNLAGEYKDTGNYQAACDLYQDVLNKSIQVYGEDHPYTKKTRKRLDDVAGKL